MRIFTEQMQELAEAIGKIFLDDIKNAMYYINGFVMALKYMVGYTQEIQKEDTTGGIIEIEDEAESATEAVEGLSSALLGLDQINVLGGTSSSTDLGGLDSAISDAINKDYSDSMTKLQNKAVEISEQILLWLGYTKQVDEETGAVSWNLSESSTRLDKILTIVKTIGSVVASFGVISFIGSIITKLVSVGSTILDIGSKMSFLASGPVAAIIAAVVLLTGLFTDLYLTNEDFRNSINSLWETLATNIAPIINEFINGVKEIVSELMTKLKPVWDSLKDSLYEIYKVLEPFLKWLVETGLPIMVDIFTNYILMAINNIVDSFTTFANIFSEIFNIAQELISLFKTGGDFISLIFRFMSGEVSTQEIIAQFTQLKEKFVEIFSNIGESFKNIFTNLFEGFKNIFSNIWNFIYDGFVNIGKGIGNFFIGILNKIISGFNKIGFDIPDWIPGIGGNHFGINIPQISYLAKGGVATTPTMAMIGEYAGAKSNPEIVAPQSIMYDTMVSALSSTMKPLVQAIVQGDSKVVNAVNDLANRPVELNGRKVSESIFNDILNVGKRKGINIG